MKSTRFLRLAFVLSLPVTGATLLPAQAQNAGPAPTAPASAAQEDVAELVSRITQKLRDGQRSPEALAAEVAEFETLVQKHREADPDGAAQILMMKALLYLQVFSDFDEGLAVLRQVEADFPKSEPAQMVPQIVAQVQKQQEAEQAKKGVVGQPAPGIDFQWASREGVESLADLKGKVVVLDFWATWCGPCVATFPQIAALTDHYEGFPVEVVGVTSLQGRVHGLEAQPIDCRNDPQKEMSLMPRYMEAKGMNWLVAFSEQQVFNPDYGVTGIPHMAIIAPDGTVRYNGIHPGIPLEEKTRLIDELLREAKLPTPKA